MAATSGKILCIVSNLVETMKSAAVDTTLTAEIVHSGLGRQTQRGKVDQKEVTREPICREFDAESGGEVRAAKRIPHL